MARKSSKDMREAAWLKKGRNKPFVKRKDGTPGWIKKQMPGKVKDASKRR